MSMGTREVGSAAQTEIAKVGLGDLSDKRNAALKAPLKIGNPGDMGTIQCSWTRGHMKRVDKRTRN